MSFARIHLVFRAEPWSGGNDVETLCGAKLRHPVAVGMIDYLRDPDLEFTHYTPRTSTNEHLFNPNQDLS